MIVREFGKRNEKIIVLVHASACMWDYYEYVIPLLERDYHLIVPALPGYDKTHPDIGHGSMSALYPAEMAKRLREMAE